MNGWMILGIFLILWGLAVIYIIALRPKWYWNGRKGQFYMKRMGEKGTNIFFGILAAVTIGAGIYLLVR
jgi:hypothetical protein